MNEDMKMVFTSPNVICPNCGNKFFKEVYALKRISPIISPTGKEEIIPIPMYACEKCGTIPQEYVKKRQYKYIVGEAEDKDIEETASNEIENVSEKETSSGIILP